MDANIKRFFILYLVFENFQVDLEPIRSMNLFSTGKLMKSTYNLSIPDENLVAKLRTVIGVKCAKHFAHFENLVQNLVQKIKIKVSTKK